jgi:hypothetical protein
MQLLLLAAALAATPPASPLDVLQPAAARTPGIGRVVQVTGARAYLDAGADDGLAAGQQLVLRRGGAEAGTCAVEAVSPGSATCTGAGARPGDTFALAPQAAPAAAVVLLPPIPSDEEAARRAAALAAAPVALVEHQARAGGTPLAAPRGSVGEVGLSAATWTSSGAGDFDVTRLDAVLRGAPAGPLTVDLDLRAERWLARSRPIFRPRDATRLEVWQAQLGWAPADRPFAVAAGRLLPWSVPGATVMDGAMLSWRGDGLEAGVFGGLVPEPDTLDPTSKRATGGGYWIVEKRLRRDLVIRQEARLAWVRSPELGDRGELEAGASAHAGSALDLFASARLGAGGTAHAPGYLDGARVEAGLRPLPRLAITAGGEYGGLAVPLAIVPPALGTRNRRADATAFYDLGPVRVGLTGGTSRDQLSRLERSWVGPEVQVPRFLTPRLALSAGWLEEQGWLDGRSAYVQAVARPWDRLRLIGRLSYAHEARLGVDQDEAAAYLSAAAELNQYLGLRLTVMGRMGFDAAGDGGGGGPSGLTASAAVFALF